MLWLIFPERSNGFPIKQESLIGSTVFRRAVSFTPDLIGKEYRFVPNAQHRLTALIQVLDSIF